MGNEQLIALARSIAAQHGLEDVLVCAVIEQESNWNPWAVRYEEGFYVKYVLPIKGLSDTEARTRSMSWGPMQILGQVARERGFANTYLSGLCDPATGIDWGCGHLKAKLVEAGGEITKGLLLWNGGSNLAYPQQVLSKTLKYEIKSGSIQ
jgi:soluble lytic murein transglycosylase-like protein